MENNKGVIYIEGLPYEDLIAILTTNGYEVTVNAKPTTNATKNIYKVEYERKECIDFSKVKCAETTIALY